MGRRSKWEYLKAIYQRYRQVSRAVKRRILDEFCQVCGYNRKYAIRLLNGRLPPPGARPPRRRPTRYSYQAVGILTAVWEAAGYPWSVRLKALVPLWLPWIRTRFALTPALEQQLLAISPRQIDRRLSAKKTAARRRLYGRTKPGTLLKHHIPLKTDHWDVTQPGYTEADLVSHSGDCAEGEFVHSLTLTDICSTWTEARAVLGKGYTEMLAALEDIRQALPFTLKGFDSDNGSEFLNHHLWRYTQEHAIQFTRSRPYKKDDNAHVEQKNWTHVRKLLGWDRYDTEEARAAVDDLYRHELREFMNLFLPSVKLLKKARVGSRLKRIYDEPKTPLDRLAAHPEADPVKVAALKRLRETLDPFELAARIDQKLERIFRLATHRRRPKVPTTPPPPAKAPRPLSRVEREVLGNLARVFGMPVSVKKRPAAGSHFS
jgi:hypothetical protein